MKSLKNLGMAAVLLVAVGVVEAQAGTISLQPVTGALEAFQTPPPPGTVAANDVIPGLWGYLNGNLVLNGALAGAKYLVEFTLIGAESGWTNQLRETQGNKVLVEETDNGNTISYVHTATGGANDFLKFQFETIAGDTQPVLVNGPAGVGSVANGGVGALRTFYVSFCINTSLSGDIGSQQQGLACNDSTKPGFNPTTGNVAWLALDDSGAGPNDNHDDWVGYVRVTAVPDGGATAGLLGVALLGLGVLRRRFRA